MRNLLIILVLALGITSCDSNVKTIDELREIKVGQTQIEVLYLLGEPYEIQLEVGYEVWRYHYVNTSKGRFHNAFLITIKQEKVTKYTSY